MRGRGRYLLTVLALALVYVAAGRLGLQLDAVSGFATLVWAPSGIALAALLAGGARLWPGVALGALAVNLWAGAALVTALPIAVGNTLEAVVAMYAIRRIPGFNTALLRTRDVSGLILFGAGISTMIGASIGTLSLYLTGVVTGDRFAVTWTAWWLGDAIGDLVVAPLLLTWSSARLRLRETHAIEPLALALLLTITALLVFVSPTRSDPTLFVQPYLLAPFLLWATLRFQQRGATASIFIISVIAVWGTTRGLGPFTTGALYQRLFAVQTFMALMAMTFLVLAAVVTQRMLAERELTSARDAAEAASRAKSRFLAVVSHELRTPLNGILGYSDLLLGDIAGSLSEQQSSYVGRIRGAAWHLVGIIDGILTFSRGDAGRHDLRLETVDATELMRDTAALLTPHAAAKQLDLHIAAPAGPVTMHTDAGKVRQILVNLLGNAVKFTDGNVIELQLERDGDWITFHVRDRGPGIPRDQLERIFEPFTQLANGNTPPAGTGLGLPVSRTLAEALGGSVVVSSEVGQGSTFTLKLPTITVAPAALPFTD